MNMPSQILHTLFGEDVIAELYRRDHHAAFALGCQGPDIFYHSQGRRPVGLEYGTLLHRRGAGDFTAGLLKLGLPEKGINALGAYALGFMTHPILDRCAHPYIVYKSGSSARTHAFFERIIDVLMLRELRGTEAASWDQETILAEPCEHPPPGLKELLATALVQAYPERAGKDDKLARRIDNTFADCAEFYRFTDPRRVSLATGGEGPPSLGALAYVYPEQLPVDIDFLNLKKAPWFYPAGNSAEDLRSFPEIYAGAAAAAASLTPMIARYLETGLFPIREAAQAIGNGGLSIQDETGKPIAPTRFAPLPLDQVLRGQAEMRGQGLQF
jgi:hypothetical protein